MSLAHVAKQIAAIPAHCTFDLGAGSSPRLCGRHGGFVALPPFRDVADRRCREHLWPDFFGKPNSSGVDPFAPLDESRPGAHSAAPSAPVRAGPGDLFDFAGGT